MPGATERLDGSSASRSARVRGYCVTNTPSKKQCETLPRLAGSALFSSISFLLLPATQPEAGGLSHLSFLQPSSSLHASPRSTVSLLYRTCFLFSHSGSGFNLLSWIEATRSESYSSPRCLCVWH